MFRAGNQWLCFRENILPPPGFRNLMNLPSSQWRWGFLLQASLCLSWNTLLGFIEMLTRPIKANIKKNTVLKCGYEAKKNGSPESQDFCIAHPELSILSALGCHSSASHPRLTVGILLTFLLQDQTLQMNSVFTCSGNWNASPNQSECWGVWI